MPTVLVQVCKYVSAQVATSYSAQQIMSAATSFNRAAFEDDIAVLQDLLRPRGYQLPRAALANLATSPPHLRDDSIIPFEIERRLANSLAMIAGWQGTPDCVSAASVAQVDNNGGTCVSIAANEGIAGSVEECFTGLLACMEQCAQCRESLILNGVHV
ncbi:hypothetical protein K461DRAFT_1897 [Myriangium duriaei CBS 260.36]|uniref:Uncharacterized protein n=1 Tax=Myriangium duriaei CBS 260.36 TaxID=1168546 RepID=A0A9P4J7S7_9PEZI|nr:hypothetical protein K461DRAFT_1897 [Myriangium duriaei CBS 260.36]